MRKVQLALAAALIAAPALPAAAAQIEVFSGAGANAASITGVVDQFRAALGGDNNANKSGTQDGGRREINWDGNGSAALPAQVFNNPLLNFTNRGSITTSPGGRMEFSGQPNPLFGDVNPQYATSFQTFSPFRLFAPLDSNVLDNFFTVPGTTDVPARTTGFGAVFVDVDLAMTTKLEFFDALDNLLLTEFVPVFDNGLSFVGVDFNDLAVAHVRMTLGNAALGPNDGNGTDVVVVDDFIFGEPSRIPEPATLALVFGGLAAVPFARRRRGALT
jgi:hypothetical protein